MHELKIYQISLYSKGTSATIKNFELEILIYFRSLIQTLNPFKPNTPYLPHSFIKMSKFQNIGSSRWKATNIL
jgi:hypothetical protein